MPTNATPKKRRDWRPVFLRNLGTACTVTDACAAAGINRTTAYRERQVNEAFAVEWADIEEATTERMEREAYRRGIDGTERDVYHQGQVVGQERQFSDTLLIFMLKARRPEKYRDNVTVQHTGHVQVNTGLVTDAVLAGEARALLRRAAAPSAN